jgi:type II restriction enzyme
MRREDLIASASLILRDLGMDAERSNERSAMTLLALAHLDETVGWNHATDGRYTTRQIMDWIQDHLGVPYAPNTRETIRRQTLHQFYEGGVVLYNDDDPSRPTNSPKNCYRLAPNAYQVILAYTTTGYDSAIRRFRSEQQTWVEQQAEVRDMARIPVKLPDGSQVHLSAGGQNKLIKQMVEEFCSRFVPNGIVLFIDDTDKALGNVVAPMMKRLNISIPEHGKAPDLIVWDEKRGWLFLMEACSTHGPIDVVRKNELKRLFEDARCASVYVSCFPDRATMRKYLTSLAWETEAWCADSPTHMVHLDGERFLGPYDD